MTSAILAPIARYTRWLHTRWPAGAVEKLPEVGEDGSTNVPGLYVCGDASREAQFVAVAAAEGAEAGMAINKALLEEVLAADILAGTPSAPR